MLTIETVDINDVYPPEDEYGNRYLSRDYDTKENKAYVQELADDIRAKGEPEEPPVLVPDGGIYRIKNGNTRIMAMRLNGVQKFSAVIDTDTTPEDLVKMAESAYRTNVKKKYSAAEEAKIAQQLFMFQPDDYLADVMHITPEQVAKRRRGRNIAVEKGGSEAEQLSMAHYEALAEFEDDPEATEQIMNSNEKRLENRVITLRLERNKKEAYAALENELIERGVEIFDDHQQGYSYIGCAYEPKDLNILSEIDDGDCIARRGPGCFWIYELDDEANLRKNDEDEARDARRAKLKTIKEARYEFFKRHFPDELENFSTYALSRVDEHGSPLSLNMREALDALEITYDVPPVLDVLNVFYREASSLLNWQGDILSDREAQVFVDVSKALVQDGYMPPEVELELLEDAEAFLAAQEKEEDENDG